MARVFIEGFEGNSLDGWKNNGGGNCTIVSSAGLDMSGSYVARVNNYNVGICKVLSAPLTEMYLAFKLRPYNANSNFILQLSDEWGTNSLCIERNTSTGILYVKLGEDGSTLITGTIPVNINTTYLIELHYIPLNSGGTVELKIDGVADGDYTGDTTAGAENVGIVALGSDNINWYVNAYYDDLVIDDADWIGNTKIQAQLVSGVGSTTSWDPSTGSNYECVNEVAYSDSDYVSTGVVDEIDTYAVADLAESVTTVKCIQVTARMSQQGAPTATKQELIIRPGSTDRSHATQVSPPLTFQRYDFLWELNPDDSEAFEAVDLNNMEVGFKAVA